MYVSDVEEVGVKMMMVGKEEEELSAAVQMPAGLGEPLRS